MVTNISELEDVKEVACSDHALGEFAVLRNAGQVRCKGRLLKFRKTDFQLSREIVRRILWKTALG